MRHDRIAWFAYTNSFFYEPKLFIEMATSVRVGAVQAEPVWLDLNGSVDKTIKLIENAAADGVQVLGFPEVWIPGYPW